MYEELKKLIGSYIDLTPEDWQLILDSMEDVHVKKKAFLLKSGMVRDFMAFVEKGAFKSYFIDSNGKEIGIQLHFEGSMIFDQSTLTTLKPTELFVQALEDSRITLFDQKAKETLIRKHPKFSPFLAGILQDHYTELQQRFVESQTLNAEERFEKLIEEHPKITQRISQQQIASYLGISPTFLSLIRKKRSKS